MAEKIKCLNCGEILEPGSFKQCSCENQTFIDGIRCGAVDFTKVAHFTLDWVVDYETFTNQGYYMQQENDGIWWVYGEEK